MKIKYYNNLIPVFLYKQNSFFAKTCGQTLIEVTIALSIILITLASIAIVVTVAVSNSTFIKNQSQAAKYSQEGIEHLRYIRESDPATFYSYLGTFCMNENNSLVAGPCSSANIGNDYVREASFDTSGTSSECSNGQVKIDIMTKWKSSKCKGAGINGTYCHKSFLTSCFQNLPPTGL